MSKTEVISVNEKPESKMVNIVSRQTKNGNIVISLEDSQYFYLPFDKNAVDLSDNKTREQFIKAIEKQVRTSKLYKAYVSYLKVECGMEHCAVFGNVTSTIKSKTKVEMHHGPIFTLYDYVSIVLDKFLQEGKEVNTFDIAAEVLDLHRRKLVQTVMLSEAVHISMDDPKHAPFLSLDQTFGDLLGFVKEYGKYFSPKNRIDLKNYLMHYQYNLEHNQLGAFKPIFTQYNIKFVKNKMEIPNNELRK